MRRRVVGILTFALCGALATFTVAWACALWAPNTPFPDPTTVSPGDIPYPRAAPAEWSSPFLAQHSSSFGSSFIGAAAQVAPGQITTYEHVSAVGQSVFQFGWPFRALEYEARLYMLDPPSGPPSSHPIHFVGDVGEVPTSLVPSEHRLRRLPIRPICAGFIANTLFYAAILWLLIRGPFALRRFLRVRRGLCPKCAYPMGESAVCTECGIALPRRRRKPCGADRCQARLEL